MLILSNQSSLKQCLMYVYHWAEFTNKNEVVYSAVEIGCEVQVPVM